MRVLTVRQPWAWAIVHGGKDVENRTRNLAGSYHGPVAIHAGLTRDGVVTLPAYLDALQDATVEDRMRIETFGAVIGVVDLTDVHLGWSDMAPNGSGPDCCHSPWAELADPIEEHEGRGIVHMMVANPRPLITPVPVRGKLGLWTPDPELADAIAANLP